MMKNTFYFNLKAPFVLEVFQFLFWIFGHIGKRLDREAKVNFKIHDVTNLIIRNGNTHITIYLNTPYSRVLWTLFYRLWAHVMWTPKLNICIHMCGRKIWIICKLWEMVTSSLEISIMTPENIFKCYEFVLISRFSTVPYQGCASGPCQIDHDFPCTRAAMVTRSHA